MIWDNFIYYRLLQKGNNRIAIAKESVVNPALDGFLKAMENRLI